MPYDEYLADRIRGVLRAKHIPFEEKKMMGGICFMVDDKMCVGADQDKLSGKNRLMARVGEQVYLSSLKKDGYSPFDITGKALKGFLKVEEEALDREEDLEYWIQLSLDFNPLAQRSKKKKSVRTGD